MRKALTKIYQIFKCKKPKKIIDTLFTSYVVMIIIPILVLGILFTALFLQHMSDQTKSNASYTIGYAARILEEQLSSIHDTAYNLMLEENILSLEKNSRYSIEQMMAVSRAKSALQRVYAQNGNIDEIYLVYLQSGTVIAANEGNTSEKQIVSLFGMENEEFYNYLSTNNGKFVSVEIISESGNRKQCMLYIKAVDRKRVSGDIYSVFFLNDMLIKEVMHMANTDNGANVMLLDEDYNCILADNEDFVYSNEYKKSITSAAKQDSKNYDSVRIGGKTYYIVSSNIALTRLKLFLVADKFHYVSVLWPIWFLILFVNIFIILISVFVAKSFSRKVYRPIGNIINMFKSDSYEYGEKSEIAFIDSKFVEIQTVKDELTKQEASQIHDMQKVLLSNFLKGYIGDVAVFGEAMSKFDICFNSKKYIVALIKIDRLSEIVKKIQAYHYQKFLSQCIFESFIEIYPQLKEKTYEFYDGEHIGLLIGFDEEIYLESGILKLQNIVREKHDITISVCISEELFETDSLVNAYKMVSHIMRQIKLAPYEYFISTNAYKNRKKFLDLQQYSKQLCLCIINQKYDELSILIDSVFTHNQVFYTDVIQLYTETVNVIVSVANSKNCEKSIFAELDVYPGDRLNDFSSLAELCEYLKKTCKNVAEKIVAISQSTNKTYEKILEYIDANYMREIGLEDIAKAFGYSKNYFSRYFKELTGKNFIELLNSYRIEKAKSLIKTDENIKLLTVAKQVGFTNYRTFSAAFRKFEGQSPEDYRRNI